MLEAGPNSAESDRPSPRERGEGQEGGHRARARRLAFRLRGFLISPDAVCLAPLCLLLALAAPHLGESPSLDPMVLYGESSAFMHGGLTEVQKIGTPLHPPMLYLINALAFLLFGRRPLAYNLAGILLFAFVSVYSYRFVRRRFGRRVAVPYVLLLFGNPMVILNAVQLSNDALILFAFIMAVVLYFERHYAVLAAVLCGVALMKETAIVVVLVLFAYAVYQRTFIRNARQRRGAFLRLLDLFVPAFLVLMLWRVVLWKFNLTEWRETTFVGPNQNSYQVLAHKLITLHVWDIFTRQNLRNAFVLNFQWVYVATGLLLLAVTWRSLRTLGRNAKRLVLVSLAISVLYAVFVFPFPTFTIPRYGLPVYFGLFLVLAVLLGQVRWRLLYSGLLAGLIAVALLSNLGSFDPVTRLYGTIRVEGQTFYELPYLNSGPDRIFYNAQFLAFTHGQNEALRSAIAARADAIVTFRDNYKLCPKVVFEIAIRNEFHPDLRVQRPFACIGDGDIGKDWARPLLQGRVVYLRRGSEAAVQALLGASGIQPARVVSGP